jgi:hypothetical protein
VFGLEGIWVRFLRRAEGFNATEVNYESADEGRYRVRDFWSGHRGFEIFRERLAEDFAEFDRQIVDALVEKQQFVGAYYEADGDDSVPA